MTKVSEIYKGRGDYSLFNKWYWKNCISICRKKKVDAYLPIQIKLSSKCDLKFEMLKLPKDSVWNTLPVIHVSKTPGAGL